MRLIHKFLVPFASVEKWGNPAPAAPLRVGAEVRHVGMDYTTGNPAIWVELDMAAEPCDRTFLAFATGSEIPDEFEFVGTALCLSLVWHVYERRAG